MKLVHDIWWTFFCQEPKLILKCQGVCQTWKEWVDMLNLKQIYSKKEKEWIWKHVCWIGNIKLIQKWEDLDVSYLKLNDDWYYYHYSVSKWNWGLFGACQGGNRELAELMIEKGANDWNGGLFGACRSGNRELADFMIEKGATHGYLIDEHFPS